MIEQQVLDALNTFKEEEEYLNILIAGATGSGKTSLINTIFGERVAHTYIGQPVTKDIQMYQRDDEKVRFVDIQGQELGVLSRRKYISQLKKLLNKANSDQEEIHMIWYCIDASSTRVTDEDIRFLKMFQKSHRPTAVVFTKADLVSITTIQQLKEHISRLKIPFYAISTKYYQSDDFELKDLVIWSANNLKEAQKGTFIRSQLIHIEGLKEQSEKIVFEHGMIAANSSFIPIPFADFLLSIPNQSKMIGRIFAVYHLEDVNKIIRLLFKKFPLEQLAPQMSRYIVGQLIRFVPGIGKISSRVITSALMGTITIAVGLTISEVAYQIKKQQVSDPDSTIEDWLQEELTILQLKEWLKKSLLIALNNKSY